MDWSLTVKFVLAFVVVLALIGLVAWLVRRFGSGALGSAAARGRQARLGVIEATAVDSRRRLVLVRRDNVEHLVLIGGPSDVVVEANIVRSQPAGMREPAQMRAPEPQMRETEAWAPEPAPRPAARPMAPVVEDLSLQPAAEPMPRPQVADRIAAEFSRSLAQTPEPRAPEPRAPEPRRPVAEVRRAIEPRRAPPPVAPPPAPPVPPVEEAHPGERHLTEMAEQLERALRSRDAALPAESPPPASTPAPVAPRMPRPPLRAPVEPRPPLASRPVVPPRPPEPPAPPVADAPAPPQAPAEPTEQPPAKTSYQSLEEEMANLLGRTPGKT